MVRPLREVKGDRTAVGVAVSIRAAAGMSVEPEATIATERDGLGVGGEGRGRFGPLLASQDEATTPTARTTTATPAAMCRLQLAERSRGGGAHRSGGYAATRPSVPRSSRRSISPRPAPQGRCCASGGPWYGSATATRTTVAGFQPACTGAPIGVVDLVAMTSTHPARLAVVPRRQRLGGQLLGHRTGLGQPPRHVRADRSHRHHVGGRQPRTAPRRHPRGGAGPRPPSALCVRRVHACAARGAPSRLSS